MWHRSDLLAGLLLSGLFVLCGCGGQPVVGPGPVVGSAKETAARDEELHNGLRYVRLMNEYDYDKASEKAISSLNSWLAASDDQREYKIDPLRAQLPKEIKPFFPTDGLASNKFRSDDFLSFRQFLPAPTTQPVIAEGVRSGDFRYLHESFLFHQIAEWAIKQSSDPQIEAWLAEHTKSLDERSARQLREVARLFDWTVRHLQLEPAPPEPARATSGTGTDGKERPSFPPALEGKPGPGYLIFPGHLLVAGRADFVQRAWIFCLLARQVECDVVMLAFENPQTSRHEPWLCGAIIGEQIYLFDPRLGLPIPLESDQGIATLAQVRENEGLLRRLDLSADMVYPANKDNLKRLVALVEFSDVSISKRMGLLESRLTGDEQMVLAVHPSQIAAAAQKAGVSEVYPWRIAYDTLLYRAYMDASLRTNFPFFMRYYTFEMPFVRPSLLATARYQHLSADFTGDGEAGGALDTYMNARIDNQTIQRLEETEEGKRLLSTKMMGDRELTQSDKAQWIAAQKNSMTISKVHASFFMGQAQYDLGAYPLAEEWFQKRNLETNPTGPWTVGAKYGLARSLEMQKKYREAREIYLADQSVQKEGSLLRARRLKSLADGQPDTPKMTEVGQPGDAKKAP